MSTSGAAAPKPAKPRAKGWLLAVSIAAIAVGALDVFTGLSTAAAPAMLRVQSRMFGGDQENPVVKAQTEVFARTAAVYERHRSAVAVGAVGRTTAGLAMVLGGIFCLRLRRWARNLLIAAYAAGATLALSLGPEMVRLQREVTAENTAHFERTIRAAGAAGAANPQVQQVTDMMGSVMRTTGSIATITAVGMVALTAAICAAGAIFLLHPKIRARFG